MAVRGLKKGEKRGETETDEMSEMNIGSRDVTPLYLKVKFCACIYRHVVVA